MKKMGEVNYFNKKIVPNGFLASFAIFVAGVLISAFIINNTTISGTPLGALIILAYLITGIGIIGLFRWLITGSFQMLTNLARFIFRKNENLTENDHDNINKMNATIIEKTLDSFGLKVKVAEINCLTNGSTQYCLKIAEGTKIEDIEKRKKDLALALASSSGTVEMAPIPEKELFSIKVPKVVKIKEEQKTEQYPKTILGKGVNYLANIIRIIALILYATEERLDNSKNTSNQLLVAIIVPIVITLLWEGKFNILKILDYYIILFITWILILAIHPNNKKKGEEDKKVKK